MSRTIDERIVQMTFENKNFEKNAGTTLSTLDKLKNALNFSDSTEGLQNLQSTASKFNLSSITSAVSSVSTSFSAMEIAAITAISNIADKVTNLGLNIAKSLTIDNVSSGFSSYEQELKTQQVLLTSTGKTIEEIEEALAKVQWYSDETSYNYTGMIDAVKSFTSQGIELNSAIDMIQGVANMAGLAGAEASQADHAFTGFAKAMASGAMSNQYWSWIKTAGLETEQIKQILIDAAEAVGTIKEGEVTIANFTENLSDDWLNADAMKLAFTQMSDYSNVVYNFKSALEEAEGTTLTTSDAMAVLEDIVAGGTGGMDTLVSTLNELDGKEYSTAEATERLTSLMGSLSKAGYENNQIYRTFTDALNSTKTAVASAWQAIFRDLFGNVVEAKETWTRFGDWLYDEFAQPFWTLEEIFSGWKGLGGRSELIEGLANLGKSFSAIVSTIKESIADIFGTLTSDKLLSFTKSFRDVTEKLIPTENTLTNIKNILEGIFKVFNTIKEFFVTIISAISKNFGSTFVNILTNVLDLLGQLGIAIGNIADGAINSKAFDISSSAIESLSNTLQNSGSIIKTACDLISNALGRIKEVFQDTTKSVGDFINANGSSIGTIAATGLFSYLTLDLASLINKIKKLNLSNLKIGFISDIKSSLETLGDSINNLFKKTDGKVDQFKKIADGLLIIAAAMVVLAAIKPDALAQSLEAMFLMLAEMVGMIYALSKIEGAKNTKKLSSALIKIGASLVLMAAALKIIASIDADSIGTALLGMTGIFTILSVFMLAVSKIGKSNIFSDNGLKNFKQIGAGMVGLGVGLIAIAAALKIIATMDWEQLAKSLTGLTVILAAVFGFAVGVSKLAGAGSFLVIGTALLILSPALIALAAALKILSTISIGDMGVALLGLVTVLGSLAGLAVLLSKTNATVAFVAFAGGLLVMSAALAVTTVALAGIVGLITVLKNMKFKDVIKSLGEMILIMVGLGVASAVLGILSPLIIAFSVALAALSAALLLCSKAMVAAAAASALFTTFGDNFSKGIATVIEQGVATLIGLIPSVITGILEGIVNYTDQLIEIVSRVISILCTGITNNINMIADTVVNVAGTVILKVLNWLSENSEKITEDLCGIVVGIINGIANSMDDIVSSVVNLFVSIIDALTDNINEGVPEIADSLGKLMAAIVTAIPKSIIGGVESFATSLWNSIFGGKDEDEAAINAGETTGNSYSKGINNKKSVIKQAGTNVGTTASEAMEDSDGAATSAENTVSGFINYVNEHLGDFTAAGQAAANAYNSGFAAADQQHSPSRRQARNAKYSILGFLQGISKNIHSIEDAGVTVADTFSKAFNTSIDLATDTLEDGINPVITPVLDLSAIESQTGEINSLFGNRTVNSALAISQGQNGALSGLNNTTNNVSINVDFSVSNAGRDLTESDINKYGSMIADRVNRELGLLM